MKLKAAYIDHSFKTKTQSNQFLKDFYSLKYKLTEYLDHTWRGGQRVRVEVLNKGNFNAIIFNQDLPSTDYIRKLKTKKVIWSPMYDQGIMDVQHLVGFTPYLDLGIKVLSFSTTVHSYFSSLGFDSTFIQYFPRPKTQVKTSKKLSIFHWMRREKINWQILKKILGHNKIEKVILLAVPDPENKVNLPSKKDIKKYNIQIYKRWLSQKQYLKLINSCNIYMAPRSREGVGLSFLEAMAKKMAVVAPNIPTMNEYITNNISGYLYDLNNPQPINLKNHLKIAQEARKTISRGWQKWQKNKGRVLIQLQKPVKKCFWPKLIFLKTIYYARAWLYNFLRWLEAGKLISKILRIK